MICQPVQTYDAVTMERIQGMYSETLVYNPGKNGLAHPIPVETTPTTIMLSLELLFTMRGPPLSAYERKHFISWYYTNDARMSTRRRLASFLLVHQRANYPASINTSLLMPRADLGLLYFCLLALWLVPFSAFFVFDHVYFRFLEDLCSATYKQQILLGL